MNQTYYADENKRKNHATTISIKVVILKLFIHVCTQNGKGKRKGKKISTVNPSDMRYTQSILRFHHIN